MKYAKNIIFLLCIASLGLFGGFQSGIDIVDAACPFEFNCSVAEKWWQKCDTFCIDLFNSYFKNAFSFEALKQIQLSNRYKIRYESNNIAVISLEPGSFGHNINIEIIPLDLNTFLVHYYRLWNEHNCETGRAIKTGTFRIFRRDVKTKNIAIDYLFEQTNFYKQIIRSNKFKYINKTSISSCEWMWTSSIEDIKIVSDTIIFNQVLILGLAGSPMQNILRINWKYRPGKLQAISYQYETQDARYDPNVDISRDVKEGKTIELPE